MHKDHTVWNHEAGICIYVVFTFIDCVFGGNKLGGIQHSGPRCDENGQTGGG